MTLSDISAARLAMTGLGLAALLGVAACQPAADAPAPVETPVVETATPEPALEPVRIEPSYQRAATLLAEGDRPAARRMVDTLVADQDPSARNQQLLRLWSNDSEERNAPLAILQAESIVAGDDRQASAAYIAGVGYWRGIGVDADPQAVVRYWDRPALQGNAAVQERLVEMYSDSTSPVYDPDAARAVRSRG